MNDRFLLIVSFGVSIFLACIKALISFFTGSVAMIASALDSVMDAFSTAMNIGFHKVSEHSADREHPFGHGKFEAIASTIQGLFILGSGLVVLYSSLLSFWNPKELLHEGWAIAVMVVSIFVPLLLSWFLKKNASLHSLILFAEGEHFSSDAFLNASVLIGVVSSLLFQTSVVDSFVGIIASAIILWRALLLLRLSGSVLLDEKLPDKIESHIIEVLNTHSGIEGWHNLRTRRSGSEFQADVHLEFRRDILLMDAHAVADNLEKKLMKIYPTLHLLTHFDIVGTDVPSCALPFSGKVCQK